MNKSFTFAAGNVTADPELRTTPSGKLVTSLPVAVNRRVKQGDDYVDGDPTFYEITFWDTEAQNVVDSYHQGARVIFAGFVHTEVFSTRDGKRSKLVVTDAELGASTRWATVAISKNTKA
jgi:single-strand DNA-binding protein